MKKPASRSLAFALVVLATIALNRPAFGSHVDDSDLTRRSPHLQGIPQDVPRDLAPDSIQTTPSNGELVLRVLRQDHQRMLPVAALAFQMTGPGGKAQGVTDENGMLRFPASSGCQNSRATPISAIASLENPQFLITQGMGGAYRIVASLPCSGKVDLLFKSDSNGGQALGIWQVATRARGKLAQDVGLGFWKRHLTFIWPADGDYYSSGFVNITRGDYWDVVGHEMGHGIYDLAGLGNFGGGQHKIDECYSPTLALSEGWASFFSAYVSVDLRDPDAKFEYMVPRRAPIRFETIPTDVCAGESNEWRVTGFFWDLIDLHEDGESVAEPFGRGFKALFGSRISSASEALPLLERAGFQHDALEHVWEMNMKSSVAF